VKKKYNHNAASALKFMKSIRPLLSVLVTASVVLAQATALADTAANIQKYPLNAAVTYDDNGSGNYPVVSAILSAPQSLDGYTYGNWSYLAQDTTGSLDLFYSSTLVPGYTPHLGDSMLVQGNYSPFSGIPEVANSTAHPISVTFGSSGNPLYTAVPVLTTIPTINVGTNGYGLSLSGLGGQLLKLHNVTISGVSNATSGSTSIIGNWAFHANNQGTVSDQSHNNMVMFLWASSYSACGAIAANSNAIPTGLVDMTGFISDFYSTVTSSITPEFVPTLITVVPEPATVGLCGLGAAAVWVSYRLRKKA
jgi:hypothetical protein